MSIIKELKKYGFTFNKGLGQNFITDVSFLRGVVQGLGIDRSVPVLEVGTGAGTLTQALAEAVDTIHTFEIDKRLQEYLEKKFNRANVTIHMQDAMKADLGEIFPGEFIVVANIPYYITTPLIMKFLNHPGCARIVVLIQDEVAERIVAQPGGKEYGALSVGVQAVASAEISKRVPRGLFTPIPSVDSAFLDIKIENRDNRIPEGFLKQIFSQRRKSISNALMHATMLKREQANAALTKAGIDVNARPEQIAVQKYVELSRVLFD